MKLLLDTHLLLWASWQPERLSKSLTTELLAPENELFFSTASLWEVAIKFSLNRQYFHIHPQLLQKGLLANDYQEIPITSEHVMTVANLPLIHKDPFDRLLIAQAVIEGMTLLTVDAALKGYSAPIRLV